MNIFITGSTGFVGDNLISYLTHEYSFIKHERNIPTIINENIVIHLAGKAHDLKKISNPSEYYKVNTELTKNIFDAFLQSNAKIFITLSSVKALADEIEGELTEEHHPNPLTHYGKSKLLAEEYILSQPIPKGKRVYILRPCMIHGLGNKGNLNLLYKIVRNGLPWPLGSFDNKRSFCSIDNLCFIIKELIERGDNIPSGVYNVADDEPISTNELIHLIAFSLNKKADIYKVPQSFIKFIAKMGDIFHLPLNSERLQKLSESYIVSNKKIKNALGKDLPINAKVGLLKTFKSFNSLDPSQANA